MPNLYVTDEIHAEVKHISSLRGISLRQAIQVMIDGSMVKGGECSMKCQEAPGMYDLLKAYSELSDKDRRFFEEGIDQLKMNPQDAEKFLKRFK